MKDLLNRENQIPIRLWMFIVFTTWLLMQGFVIGYLFEYKQVYAQNKFANEALTQTQRCINGFAQCEHLLKACKND